MVFFSSIVEIFIIFRIISEFTAETFRIVDEYTEYLSLFSNPGKSVGFVTVTRVTDATPASLYANVADRSWEGDHYTSRITGGCKDIASQLIDDYKNVQVDFYPNLFK